jgi:tellurite resistance protein
VQQLLPLTSEQIHVSLCAMKTVAVANRTLSDEERALLEAVAETLGVQGSADSLEAVSPEAVAEAIPDPDARGHVAQMLVFTAQIDGAVTSDELRVIDAFAGALGVESAWLDEVRDAARRHLDTLRLDMVRRVPFPKGTLNDTWDDSGWKGLWGLFRTASQSIEDADLAWRHKALGMLPEGTLGRAYWAYMTSRRFLFPGERGAVAPEGGRHDFLHVVSGYDTDAVGETEVTAFDAGMAKLEDPFGLLFGTLCMFHLGQKLRGAQAIEKPRFDAERVGRAYRRGLLAEVDLGAGWDIWANIEKPLEDLRKQYNIHIP